MDLLTLLDMVATGMGDRVLIGGRKDGLTGAQLRDRAAAGGRLLADTGAHTVAYLGGNGPAFPVALFSAAAARVPFLPLNYRLSDEQLSEILHRQEGSVVLTDSPDRVRRLVPDLPVLTLDEFTGKCASAPADATPEGAGPEAIALLLMTSGTTAAPKSAVLRHQHLTSYILGSVEFASAEATDATIVSVPPYHIAAVANLLSNLYSGRRIVYLDHFTAAEWLDTVRTQAITHAMVVPTMLARIVREIEQTGAVAPPTLRALSYGGAKVSANVIADALRLFPDTDFVNAYGLTETSSSVAVLGPEDHRQALASYDPVIKARLGSVGRALPGVVIGVHDDEGRPCAAGVEGDIVIQGPQVAGEYLEAGSRLDDHGWFPTRDRGYLDADGYLFIRGRADDTIIRGGENIAPAEIEDVIATHAAVLDCAVAGIPDEEWGHRIGAFVVLKPDHHCTAEELREFVRARLRGSKTPDMVTFLDELPTTPTGKVLRRTLVSDLVVHQ
ncbi:class I adenylate-forming enzyme family protein [Streptomyces sp. NPDC020792]|uniref:class I adenylate-forming enzyme family protein n=1 Tax=Streptomyces sp. NPDC020792 TaxID=3365089 RepID=UPI003796B331